MGALRLDLTSVRRAVGAAVVSLLFGGAVVYALFGPDLLSSDSSVDTTANPAPSGAVTQRAPPDPRPTSAGPSSTSGPMASTSPRTPGAGDRAGSGSAGKEPFQVAAPASAKPFETVRIRGTYRGGTATFLEVQRWDTGRWRAFPLPTKTDGSGRFTAHVELGQPGRHWLRIRDRGSGTRSKPFLLVIRG